ncbi:MAG TPA: C25 family cysteine peptidase, partial [candidate division Zixibacteria bacterium]|nr:C25 family cysteine peptidase [candidate division Zixibacteria bacterium]
MFSSKNSRYIIMYLVCVICPFEICSALSNVLTIEGRAIFYAKYSLISIDTEVKGLVFDTSECLNCKSIYPAWRFIGDLKVDSLIQADGTSIAVTQESQLENIVVSSEYLSDALKEINTLRLKKLFPEAEPEDTLYWDPIRQKWHILPDLSAYYDIQYSDTLSYDTVLQQLLTVPNIGRIGRVQFPTAVDGWLEELVSPWYPNDSAFADSINPNWALGTKNPNNTGGINAALAWGLLPDGYRGFVNLAVIDYYGVDIKHPDLDGKFSGWGDTTVERDSVSGASHGTGVAGIALAETNNDTGVAGVAPDAILMPYHIYDRDSIDLEHWLSKFSRPIYTGAKVMVWASHLSDPITDSAQFYAFHDLLVVANAYNIIVVVPSGNYDYDTGDIVPYMSYPSAWDDLCVSVGAHYESGIVPWWSNYGCDICPDFPDVLAPGVDVATTSFHPQGDGTHIFVYADGSGTSYAAPVVAGMAALARGITDSLSPEIVEQFLEQTAEDTLLPIWNGKYGAGNVDAFAFVQAIRNTFDPNLHNSTSELSDSLNPKFGGREALTVDSVPCMIIADSSMLDELLPLAIKRQKMGTWTGIVLTYWINTTQSGADLQEKIRNCIKYYHDERHTNYFILAGNESIIPYRKVYTYLRAPEDMFISDNYYACLDGDWNLDSDTLWGEVEDSIDLEPDVAVGRLPISTAQQATDFIEKLDSYEHPNYLYWQTRVLSLGSLMFAPGDGRRFNEALLDSFPSEFEITGLYDDSGSTTLLADYFSAMNSGQGIVLKHGNGDEDHYALDYSDWPKLYLTNDHVDTLSNDEMPSVVISATCYGQKYDLDCMAEHYMNHETGGAVAYVGSTYNDYVFSSYPIVNEMFSQLFGSGPKQIGNLLNLGKETILGKATVDGPDRHVLLNYALSGDPLMWIWTDTPKVLSMICPDTFTVSSTITRNFSVYVSSEAGAVESSLVCIRGTGDVYSLKYTNSQGLAYFSLIFGTEGYASVVASKYNYIYVKDSIHIKPVSSCPMLYAWDGNNYRFYNNILAHSEDELNNDYASEFYPIYNAPISNGKVNLKIMEEENEVSSIRMVKGYRVEYTDDQKIVFTNHNRFQVLSDQFLPPSNAMLNGETDVSSLVSSQDGIRLVVDEPGFLIVKYSEASLSPTK